MCQTPKTGFLAVAVAYVTVVPAGYIVAAPGVAAATVFAAVSPAGLVTTEAGLPGQLRDVVVSD